MNKPTAFAENICKGVGFVLPDNKKYGEMVKKSSPPSSFVKDFIFAFVVGGLICVVGQLLFELFNVLDISEKIAKMSVPSILIFAASLLTGIGVFDKIAKRAGAGTLVPITGFSNAVTSPAIEFKKEGWVLGLGANMFKIAGPVIVYGTVASVIYGLIYWIMGLF